MTWTALSKKQKVNRTVLACVLVLLLTVGLFAASTLDQQKSEAEIMLAAILEEYDYQLETVEFHDTLSAGRAGTVTTKVYKSWRVDGVAAERTLALMSEECEGCTVSPFMYSMGVTILGDGIRGVQHLCRHP